ncbi:metalloregulator ArsR/SmtB family transcription factor [Nocardioides sp. MAH-18]|uniref:Metalloregulator ArsR/SmtB family transcription factor n=1 Tax=Nocardioides agri TaxID=2682843 RepID=A0A6L6XR24_9ACTN|nr:MULTISPECIES: metalloregulator ArsR/SmtB family transcription factor [unclassified Nocardioides]MBA2954920.1 winged helix-turn-helix transcriptional regulator [Nocardioides sp. CGMCC 1.13656]MVQ49774.1 metalloregulator ArsR/SmtB family transcription factor [Nocardioides sp. MAH-18]
MAATVALGPDAPGRTRVRPAPLVEAMLALHVLAEPGHHPEQHPFVREMRALPPAFRADLARRRATFSHLPEQLINPHPDPTADLPVLLGALAEVDAEVAGLVADFWDLAFAAEWSRLLPTLERAGAAMAAEIADTGVLALLDRVAPWIAARPARHEVQFGCTASEDAAGQEPMLTFDVRGLPVTVVPSAFAAPHVYVDVETPAAVQFAVPVQAVVREASPPAGLAEALLACGSEARLRLLHALAERPRTVQELAPMLSMAPSTASRHLQRLAEHGLVTSERDGWYVLYRACPDRLEEVTRQLAGYAGGPRRSAPA